MIIFKQKKLLPVFHSGGDKTIFKALFGMLITLGHICYSFEFVLVSISLIQEWRVKGTVSIKIQVTSPPNKKQIPHTGDKESLDRCG